MTTAPATPAAHYIPKPPPLNYRIIGSDLFQPLLTLNLNKNNDRSITGIAEITTKEIGRELNLKFKVSGNFCRIADSNKVLIKLRGYPVNNFINEQECIIEMEMCRDWNSGLATYRYHKEIVKNAAVSSLLFTTMNISIKSLWL